MSSSRRVARNMAWNWGGMAAGILASFFLTRVLVGRLGDAGYGLWVLIASLNGYFGLLDLGVRGAVGRNMACARARGETEQVNALLSTALALLAVPAALALAGTGVVMLLFFDLFQVPADLVSDVRLALALTGISLAVSILLSVFDAALWSMQRFDVLNAIDLPVTVLRVGLTCLLVGGPGDLAALAWVTLLTNVTAGAVKALCTFGCDPAARIGPSHLRRSALGGLLAFGCWSWLLSVSRIVTTQIGPVLLGSWLGVATTATFNVAARLVASFASLLMAGTGVLTPLAAGLHATNRDDAQQHLVRDGGKYCFALALFFLGFVVCLGGSLLRLWIGAAMPGCYPLLVILTAGELLPLSQWVGSTVMVGKGRHGLLAGAGWVENVLIVLLAACLLRPWGLLGMGVALAVPAFLCRGVFQVVLVCRAVELPVTQYVRTALLPALAAAALPIAALALLTSWQPPARWLDLLTHTTLFTAAYAGSGLLLLVPRPLLAAGLARVRLRLPRLLP